MINRDTIARRRFWGLIRCLVALYVYGASDLPPENRTTDNGRARRGGLHPCSGPRRGSAPTSGARLSGTFAVLPPNRVPIPPRVRSAQQRAAVRVDRDVLTAANKERPVADQAEGMAAGGLAPSGRERRQPGRFRLDQLVHQRPDLLQR